MSAPALAPAGQVAVTSSRVPAGKLERLLQPVAAFPPGPRRQASPGAARARRRDGLDPHRGAGHGGLGPQRNRSCRSATVRRDAGRGRTRAQRPARRRAAAGAGRCWRSTTRPCSGPTPAPARDPTACDTTTRTTSSVPGSMGHPPRRAAAPADRRAPTARPRARRHRRAAALDGSRSARCARPRRGRAADPRRPAAVRRTPAAAAPIPWWRARRPPAAPSRGSASVSCGVPSGHAAGGAVVDGLRRVARAACRPRPTSAARSARAPTVGGVSRNRSLRRTPRPRRHVSGHQLEPHRLAPRHRALVGEERHRRDAVRRVARPAPAGGDRQHVLVERERRRDRLVRRARRCPARPRQPACRRRRSASARAPHALTACERGGDVSQRLAEQPIGQLHLGAVAGVADGVQAPGALHQPEERRLGRGARVVRAGARGAARARAPDPWPGTPAPRSRRNRPSRPGRRSRRAWRESPPRSPGSWSAPARPAATRQASARPAFRRQQRLALPARAAARGRRVLRPAPVPPRRRAPSDPTRGGGEREVETVLRLALLERHLGGQPRRPGAVAGVGLQIGAVLRDAQRDRRAAPWSSSWRGRSALPRPAVR